MTSTATETQLQSCLRQAQPKLSDMLQLLFSESAAFGQDALWVRSVIDLTMPLGFQERAIRTALFRLGTRDTLQPQRHGRRSQCTLTPATATAIEAERQRMNMSPQRSFDTNWIMLVNSGGLGALRYAAKRKQLHALDYCLLAPNVMARPVDYGCDDEADYLGLAGFEVSGSQLATACGQPLFGKSEWDLATPRQLYRQFQQRYEGLREALGQPGAISDQQAWSIRLLAGHDYRRCRRADPLLPREWLPQDWPAMAAYETYIDIYEGCAAGARRHVMKLMEVDSHTAAPVVSQDLAAARLRAMRPLRGGASPAGKQPAPVALQ